MTTIRDVAKLAKVSVTSASYGLNGNGTLSAVTRERVLAAAEALNYHPNAFARNLKNPKTQTIGVFISRFGGSFYEEILEGIHDVALQTGYELLVCPDTRGKRKILTHRQVDGAIVFDSKVASDVLLKLASGRFPIVVLDRDIHSEHVLPLLLDNVHGVTAAFEHLYGQGARRIDFVAGAESFDNQERQRAFLGAAEQRQVSIRIYQGNFTEQSGYEAGRATFATPDRPEAVFCANDQMAIGYLRAMREVGLSAPDDIAVVGFDDIQVARYMQPALTTVGASRLQWGAAAAQMLIEFMEHGHPFASVRIPTQLILRASSLKAGRLA
ncbi:MAG: LacI family DNA-binding transcriptional regulator [Anaerolineales bacterium]